jgi:group I intron endonuclease
MFIYKITVIPTNESYIGFDTAPSYKLARWKTHCRNSKSKSDTKLYKAMATAGLKNCRIEIIEDNFTSIVELALAEINYIKEFNTYKNGLNSTTGGDGLGRHILHQLSDDDILKIKDALGNNLRNYNKTVKWANTSVEERKQLTKHLHTDEIYRKKSATLKEFYKANPAVRQEKSIGITKWQQENKEELKTTNRINGLKGAKKVSKKLMVEKEDGTMLYFQSKSDFNHQTNQWANTIIKKTKQGIFYNGYKVWEQ